MSASKRGRKGILLPSAAKDLLKRGFWIFPTRPEIDKDRRFYNLRWSLESTNDPAVVSEWAHRAEYKNCNWGVATGPSGLMVLDVDGDIGEASLEVLEDLYEPLPETLVCRTASGGRHLFFRGKAQSTTSVGWDGSKLDSRSEGGMVFAAGSVVGESKYAWEIDCAIADCPSWLIDVVGEAKDRERQRKLREVLAEDEEVDIARGKDWLEDQDPAIQGNGGEQATFTIMQRLRDYGLSVDKCAEVVFESEWNQRCEPPWELDELTVKARNAATYSYGDQGSRSIVVEFDDLDSADSEEEDDLGVRVQLDPMLVELNLEHSKQLIGGKHLIWTRQHGEEGETNWVPIKRADFLSLYEHRQKECADGKIVPVGLWWLRHPKHMRSKGIVLDPERPSGPTGRDKAFNLWCGWGIAPRRRPEGGERDYIRLITEALCSGNKKHAKYVLDWCALLLQHPTQLPKVALVFRGQKGTGKSALGLALCEAFGPHAVKVDLLSAVTGQFNWHLKNKVFLLAEEIKWRAEKGSEGVMKSLITDWKKGYESKGVNMTDGSNYLSVMINSNSDWVIPASLQDERRFAMFDVDNQLKRDTAFWKRLYGDDRRLRPGPIADFLGYLRAREIGSFDPIREAPKTEALVDQAIESMSRIERWWFDRIEQGVLPGLGEPWTNQSSVPVLLSSLYQDCAEAIEPNHRQYLTRRGLGRYLTRFGLRKTRQRVDGQREYVYQIPSLPVARSWFFDSRPVLDDKSDF